MILYIEKKRQIYFTKINVLFIFLNRQTKKTFRKSPYILKTKPLKKCIQNYKKIAFNEGHLTTNDGSFLYFISFNFLELFSVISVLQNIFSGTLS